jgi:hypothetical protein
MATVKVVLDRAAMRAALLKGPEVSEQIRLAAERMAGNSALVTQRPGLTRTQTRIRGRSHADSMEGFNI